MKFANVENDIAFRKIFGNENKKIILISFLNAVLRLNGTKKIADVFIQNPFQLPINQSLKATIIDVNVKDESGNEYIIEMQMARKAVTRNFFFIAYAGHEMKAVWD